VWNTGGWGGGEGVVEVQIEFLRSWQLSRKKREEKLKGGGWLGPPQLPVHRSQWKFIFPIGHISFRIRQDSMLKLIRNYINPIGFAVHSRFSQGYAPSIGSSQNYLVYIVGNHLELRSSISIYFYFGR
jgi:hypothetical protein